LLRTIKDTNSINDITALSFDFFDKEGILVQRACGMRGQCPKESILALWETQQNSAHEKKSNHVALDGKPIG
jgi:hypothetical protein